MAAKLIITLPKEMCIVVGQMMMEIIEFIRENENIIEIDLNHLYPNYF